MKIFKGICRIVLAGLAAVAVLSGFMCVYKLNPVHHENPKGNTDYVWEANAPWVTMTEGISWGRFDADGYNNKTVVKNPDVIVLGSSHMDSVNVFPDQAVPALLTNMLKDRYTVYNYGISGHHLFKVCQYLPVNLSMHDAVPKVAVIETSSVRVTEEKVQQMLNHEVDFTPSNAKGIIGKLQKVPFFRFMYHQVEAGLLDLFMNRTNAKAQVGDEDVPEEIPDEAIDEKAYDELFQYLAKQEKEFGTQIIIFFHPKETLDDEKGITYNSGAAAETFAAYAQKYGIDFIDLAERFHEMYEKEHLAAHGFITGEIAAGHLNANGHRAAAEEVCKIIDRLEKEGTICR